jgi:hypothetical protein
MAHIELVSFIIILFHSPPSHPPPKTPTPPAATAAPAKLKTIKGAKITDLDADEAALSVTEVGVCRSRE